MLTLIRQGLYYRWFIGNSVTSSRTVALIPECDWHKRVSTERVCLLVGHFSSRWVSRTLELCGADAPMPKVNHCWKYCQHRFGTMTLTSLAIVYSSKPGFRDTIACLLNTFSSPVMGAFAQTTESSQCCEGRGPERGPQEAVMASGKLSAGKSTTLHDKSCFNMSNQLLNHCLVMYLIWMSTQR